MKKNGKSHTVMKNSNAMREVINESMSEEEFMAQVIQLLDLCHWRYYHTYRSTRSPAGFPDIAAVRGNSDGSATLIFLEIKKEKGKLTEQQFEWLSLLNAVPGVVAMAGRPSDWAAIADMLK